MSGEQRTWCVVYTYPGYEKKVKKNLEYPIDSLEIGNHIFRVGDPHAPGSAVSPGCVLVEMLADSESLYVVRNTPGVTDITKLDL